MRTFAAISGAVRGWRALIAGDEDWRAHFALDASGMITALVIYLLFAFLAIVIGTAGFATLSLAGTLVGLFVLGLNIWALVITAYGVRIVLQSDRPVLDILVPGTYALTSYLVLGTVLSSFGPPMITLALGVVGLMLYRLGRIAGGWNAPVAAGFAIVSALLLVVMPMSLYMLTGPALPPP